VPSPGSNNSVGFILSYRVKQVVRSNLAGTAPAEGERGL